MDARKPIANLSPGGCRLDTCVERNRSQAHHPVRDPLEPRGAQEAGELVDFLLQPSVQRDIPLNMFVYPARSDVELPQVFTDFSPVPVAPVEVAVDTIELNRETWIIQWTDILR